MRYFRVAPTKMLAVKVGDAFVQENLRITENKDYAYFPVETQLRDVNQLLRLAPFAPVKGPYYGFVMQGWILLVSADVVGLI